MSDPQEPTGEPVGSVSEEAAKLFGALSGWARDQGTDVGQGLAGLADHAASAARQVDGHLATGAPECTYCPVCRTVHVVRNASPEVRAQLVSAASSLLQAASGLLATTVPTDSAARPVQRIDLDDADPDHDDHDVHDDHDHHPGDER